MLAVMTKNARGTKETGINPSAQHPLNRSVAVTLRMVHTIG